MADNLTNSSQKLRPVLAFVLQNAFEEAAMKTFLLIGVALAATVAYPAETLEVQLQRAIQMESASGDLGAAIDSYKKIAASSGSNRALAARALMQEARCYEKLGQDQAVRIYEQVVRDYRDQSEPTAIASARLAALRRADGAARATMTQRRVELPYPFSNVSFSNGHQEIYIDAVTGALMITDLAGRDKRVFFRPKAGDSVPGFYPSRDFSMVVMGLIGAGEFKGAVVRTDGTGYREVVGASGAGLPCDPAWSWDNRYLFLCTRQPDGTRQLMRISIADGEIRHWATESVDHRPSPNGRFIALSGSFNFGKVSVQPGEGGQPQLVSDNARLVDWTRDGRYLIVSSARSGSEALYLLPVKEGRLAGDPVFLRYGACYLGFTNADGALVCQSTPPGGAYTAWLGTLDSGGRLLNWKQLNLNGSRDRFSALATRWSPDSTGVLYEAAEEASGRGTVRLRNVASGEDRELYRSRHEAIPFCVWAVQPTNLFCGEQARDPAAGIDLVSVSTESGHVEQIAAVTSGTVPFFVSRDDGSLYMMQAGSVIRWQIGTGLKTTLDRIPGYPFGGVPVPNEHWMARRDKDAIEIRSLLGGEWKPLVFLDPTQMAFTADGSGLLYHDSSVAGKQGLFRVATAGGQPQRVGDFPSSSREGTLNISPDGKRIIAEVPLGTQVWLLENFEPKTRPAH